MRRPSAALAALLLVALVAWTALAQQQDAAAAIGTAFRFQPSARLPGACGYPSGTPVFAGQAALSPLSSLALQTSPLSGCGICLQIDSEAGASAVVQVTDTCDSCAPGQLNLDSTTFDFLSNGSSAGAVALTLRPVECRPFSNITVVVIDFRASDGGWLRLALNDVAGASGVANVELRQTPLAAGGRLDIVSSSWRRMHNLNGAVWELSGVPEPPLDLRVSDGAGRQILARKVIYEAGLRGSFNSTAQFPLSSSAAGIAAASSMALTLPEVAVLLPPVNETEASAEEEALLESLEEEDEGADAEEAAAAPSAEPLHAPPANATASSPGHPCNTTLSVLSAHKSLSVMSALLRVAGLEAALLSAPDTPFTIFAPTNAAWMATVRQIPLLRLDPDLLKSVLLHHVLIGLQQFGPELARYDTVSGSFLTIRQASANSTSVSVISAASAGTAVQEALPACGSSIIRPINSVLLPALGSKKRRMRRFLS